jgi:hypothetical protein
MTTQTHHQNDLDKKKKTIKHTHNTSVLEFGSTLTTLTKQQNNKTTQPNKDNDLYQTNKQHFHQTQ